MLMKTRALIATVAALALVGAACGGDDDDDTTADTETETEATTADDDDADDAEATATDTTTIVAVAVATPELATLVTAVQAAELVETLEGAGPFTVFAPTNAAFAALPPETLDKILADKELLTKILTYHVVSGSYPAQAVTTLPDIATGAQVPTVEGQSITIVSDGTSVMVNDATVETADVNASNGVVHVIDKVLIPPDVTL